MAGLLKIFTPFGLVRGDMRIRRFQAATVEQSSSFKIFPQCNIFSSFYSIKLAIYSLEEMSI